ncbi:YoaH family protein [Sodalis-like endosymbiont of Proechinophthirus fluctus]|uniref:YoaH family protein n=1 Tax=Sodalis-like endosymbiont of Proechinophthirus fluctus TaxID=1462730 RepID=UPI003F74E00B
MERIKALMTKGMDSGKSIALVACELRAGYTSERVTLFWEDEEETEDHEAPAGLPRGRSLR